MAVNKGIETWLFEYMEKSIKETPFYNLLGVELVEIGPGEAALKVLPTEQHTNPLGIIHGGLLMSLADAAMGNAVRSLGIRSVTVDMSTSFVSSAMIGQEIIGRGKVIKAGRNLIFVEAAVSSNEKLLVKSTGTFFKTGEVTK